METKYKSRLAKLAITLLKNTNGKRILNSKKGFKEFDMSLYECGTSCCFLGYAPEVFDGVKDETRPPLSKFTSWSEICRFVTGSSEISEFWNFLFDPSWPNMPKQAAARALRLLETGKTSFNKGYRGGCYAPRFFTKLNKAQLIERLEKFL